MQINTQKSLGRLCRQIAFVPCLHNRWLNAEVKTRLASTITKAERGHVGEIYLIIENHLPIHTAYRQDCWGRAVDLFGVHRVWDTSENTGILIYVNLCERSLHVIADRGIDAKAHDDWQGLCDTALIAFKHGQFEQGLTTLITHLGDILNIHYPSDDVHGNELSNNVVYLK